MLSALPCRSWAQASKLYSILFDVLFAHLGLCVAFTECVIMCKAAATFRLCCLSLIYPPRVSSCSIDKDRFQVWPAAEAALLPSAAVQKSSRCCAGGRVHALMARAVLVLRRCHASLCRCPCSRCAVGHEP